MTTKTIGTWIKERRSKLALDAPTLARASRINGTRLDAIETSREEATFEELRRVSRILGIDLATYDPDEGGSPEQLPSVTTLMKSAGGFIPASQWNVVVDAAEVAREIVALEDALGRPSRFEVLSERFPDGRFSKGGWQEGRRLAMLVREVLSIEAGPIPSMLRLCERLGIVVVETWLPQGISALCLADEAHGPTIILNLAGYNESAFVRRFTLAHEVCHILFDRHGLEPLQTFDSYAEASDKSSVEQRADAFSVQLLAPEEPFRVHWKQLDKLGFPPEITLRKLMERFGVGFQAMRSRAVHLGLLSEEASYALSTVDTTPPGVFVSAEEDPTAKELFTPIRRERRGALLRLTLEALGKGIIGTSKALELLDLSADAFAERRPDWCQELGLAC